MRYFLKKYAEHGDLPFPVFCTESGIHTHIKKVYDNRKRRKESAGIKDGNSYEDHHTNGKHLWGRGISF